MEYLRTKQKKWPVPLTTGVINPERQASVPAEPVDSTPTSAPEPEATPVAEDKTKIKDDDPRFEDEPEVSNRSYKLLL